MSVDDLGDYGISRMDADGIDQFLSSQRVGILGLPTDGAPALRPLSYWYDGESSLYFLYVLAPGSSKVHLTDRADAASFLAYRAATPFDWRSVSLTGTVEPVPDDERDAIEAAADLTWRPRALEEASADRNTRFYQFDIETRDGLEHHGLPPGFDTGTE